MTETPRAASSAMRTARRSNSAGVRLEVGSSMARTLASSITARAISTTWRWATLRVRMGAAGSMAGSSGARAPAAARSCRRRATSRPPAALSGWPRNMFWATVSSGTCWSSWWIIAIPARRGATGPGPGKRTATIRPVPGNTYAIDLDVPRGGVEDARQDAQERRLAGAVLAQEPVDGAPPHHHIHAVEGAHGPEALADARQPQAVDFCTHRMITRLPGEPFEEAG